MSASMASFRAPSASAGSGLGLGESRPSAADAIRRWRTARRWGVVAVCAGFAVGASGCAVPSPLDDPGVVEPAGADAGDDAADDNVVPFDFAEDGDPGIAALPFVANELLARILPGASADDLDAAYELIGVGVLEKLSEISTVALRVAPERFNVAARDLSTHPLFESVHKSYLYDADAATRALLPDDSSFTRQDHFEPIGVDDAWDTTTGSSEMIIAILDTGVQPDHPDLAGKLLDGWNAYDRNANSDDVLGHGTAVAGSAAAIADNREGVAGVAWDNPILPVRVSDDEGRAASRDIAAGIFWAVHHGARVINISFAPLGSDRTVLEAARFARNSGALVFISTGNQGKAYRSRMTTDAVFVGALDGADELASFSNTGPFVDLVAPGTGIYTTKTNGSYGRVSGTSFASPIVAGVAALVWSVNPDFRPTTVQTLLTETAVDLGQRGRDDSFGAGRVDAVAAVTRAVEFIEEGDTRPPTADILEPADRSTVSGVVRVSVGAFDAGELADVVLFVDGVPFATDTSAPYRFAVNTRDLADGSHTLTAVATDLSGNSSSSDPVRITVRGGSGSGGTIGSGDTDGNAGASGTSDTAGLDTVPPQVRFDFPADGARVLVSVGVQATLSDDVGLRTAEWLVDGARQEAVELRGTLQVVHFLWNATDAVGGAHSITIRVSDGARNEAVATLRLLKE